MGVATTQTSLLVGSGGTPTIVLGSAAGAATATFSITGTNLSGIISLTTGTALSVNSPLFTITLADNVTFPNRAFVVLQSTGPNVLDIVNNLLLGTVTANSNTFNIRGISLSPATEYKLMYMISGM